MYRLIAMSVVLGLFGLGAAIAAEKKVKMSELPPAVQQTVKEQTKNATLVGLSKETEGGKTTYEAETKVNGRTRDIEIDAAGVVIDIEEEVPLDSIPAAAKAAIEKQVAGGKIRKVETVTKGNTLTYEAAVTINGKKSEIAVAADGSPVK